MLMEREWAKGSRFLPEQWQEPLLSMGLEYTGLPGTLTGAATLFQAPR